MGASTRRTIVTTSLSYLAIACLDGSAQPLAPLPGEAYRASGFGNSDNETDAQWPFRYLFAVNVLLDEATSPLRLGIRDGQSVAQAADSFCHEQGVDEAMRMVLMPQLIQILENGVTEATGTGRRSSSNTGEDETMLPSLRPSSHPFTLPESRGSQSGRADPAPLPGTPRHRDDDPILILEISVDEKEPRPLYYFSDQDPADVAAAFCKQNVVSGSSPEAVTRCFDNLWDLIRERLGVENVTDKDNGLDEHRRQRGRVPQLQERPAEVEPYPVDERPWLMVPLNVNGHDATLGIERESRPQDLARELCGNKELNLEGLSLDTCFSQIVDIADRAMTLQLSRERDAREREKAEPFSFEVPVTLAGFTYSAVYRTNETPRTSAVRFCEPHLPAIETALGLDFSVDGGAGVAPLDDEQGGEIPAVTSEGRESLREACALVVEDAINAVLLGLRERVLEAETAQANMRRSN